MRRSTRGARGPFVTLIVAVVVGLAVLAGLIDVIISAGDESSGDLPPTGKTCERLLAKQGPDLMAQANRILKDQTAVSAIADCRSGAYPSAEGPTADSATDIVERMRRLGTVERRSPDECLKYLSPAECGELWAYQPAGSRRHYVVAIDPRTDVTTSVVQRVQADIGIELER